MNSGKVTIENNIVSWIWKTDTLSKFNVNDILVIGELTVESLKDDYYLLFVLKDGTCERISMYAENSEKLLEFLAQEFDKIILETQLANSVKWNNKISYPKHLRGNEVFNLVENKVVLSNEIKKNLKASH